MGNLRELHNHKVKALKLLIENFKLNEQNKQLKTLSTYDPVTGIFNRRVYEEDLESFIKSGIREIGELEYSIIVMDLDNFKYFNDIYGHCTGDKILKETASILTQHLRDSDRLYRYGGDEFVILHKGRIGHNDALNFSIRLNEIISTESIKFDNKPFVLSMSFGISTLTEMLYESSEIFDKELGEYLFKFADLALYQSKLKGKNAVTIFNPF